MKQLSLQHETRPRAGYKRASQENLLIVVNRMLKRATSASNYPLENGAANECHARARDAADAPASRRNRAATAR